MIHSGDPVNEYVDMACRHVLLRQGVLGIKVKIMLPWDPSGKIGPKKPLPDHVSIVEPKEETLPPTPSQRPRPPSPTSRRCTPRPCYALCYHRSLQHMGRVGITTTFKRIS